MQSGCQYHRPSMRRSGQVLEFEPIYAEEAKGREKLGGRGRKKVCINDTDLLERGPARLFMARDSAASEMSVQRVLYIKAHDAARFSGKWPGMSVLAI